MKTYMFTIDKDHQNRLLYNAFRFVLLLYIICTNTRGQYLMEDLH
jgi:hypothetical protein